MSTVRSASALAAVGILEEQVLPVRRHFDATDAVHEVGGPLHPVGREGENDAWILENGEDLLDALGATRHPLVGGRRCPLVPVEDVDSLLQRLDDAPVG